MISENWKCKKIGHTKAIQKREQPDALLYRRKNIPVLCPTFFEGKRVVCGETRTRYLAPNKSCGIVLSRTQLLFRHHVLYFV